MSSRMTTQQIILWACAYLVELVAVIYFTRATEWRVVGALAGGAAARGCWGWARSLCARPWVGGECHLRRRHTSCRFSILASRSRLRQSTSSTGGWPAGSGGAA